MNEILKRSEVDENQTWDLTPIFKDDLTWEKELETLKKDIEKLDEYKDNMADNLENFKAVLMLENDLSLRFSHLYVYAHLKGDEDTTNSKYQEYNSKVMELGSIFSNKATFIEMTILEMDENLLKKYLEDKDLKIFEFEFEKLLKTKKHKLSQQEEELLATISPLIQTPSKAFSMLNNADIKFDDVYDKDNNKYPLTHARYAKYLESSDRVLRENAYNSMYKTFGGLKNTFATTLEGNCKNHVILSKLKKYSSSREQALANNFIDESVYDALINAVNEKLPSLHKYMKLRKKYLGLDKMYMYDTYVPLVKDCELTFTYEEAKNIIIEALKPLGEDYSINLKKAFNDRWIDYVENEGKRSGAYSSGTYGTNPYILMSYKGTIDNLFTLIHELGHSLHSYYTRNYQPYIYGSYTIFLAEIASTTNEMLLNNYLMEKYKDDKKVVAYLLNHHLDRIKATVYRQTQFAEFEYEIHTLLEKGTPLTADNLSSLYDKINRKYYGEAITYDNNIAYEWTRIPHFYYNFYVYQYATGMSAACAFSKKILNDGEEAVNKYIDYLKSGCSDYSLNILRKAGLDMSTNKPVFDCLDEFSEKLDEFEKILNEL